MCSLSSPSLDARIYCAIPHAEMEIGTSASPDECEEQRGERKMRKTGVSLGHAQGSREHLWAKPGPVKGRRRGGNAMSGWMGKGC